MSPNNMDDHEEFESKYVHEFYSQKSKTFSNTRIKPWPLTRRFLEERNNGNNLILDSGCGNGRQFINENIIGLDYSENLLLEARNKENLGLIKGNVHKLPFKDSVFDIVLSVAVIHHLCTHERRLHCLLETNRVLKSGGECLIYAWHKDASKKNKFHKMDGEEQEYLVSWKGEEDKMRYYCLFDEKMLEDLIKEAGFEIKEIGREQESIYAIITKPN